MADRLLISHSEADSFGQCERKHMYAHIQKLQPKKRSEGLARGNAGHKLLEVWAKSKISGMSDEESEQAGIQESAGMPNAAQGMKLALNWIREDFPELGWKLVSAENQYRLQLTPTLVYPFKFDLLVEINGELVLVDHKFLYDFYTQQMLDIFPQMPKYIFGLRQLGLPVQYAIYNMFRTRNVTDPTKMHMYGYTMKGISESAKEFRMRDAMREQLMNMKQIEANRQNPKYLPVRSANKMNCGHCGFADICEMEARGESTKLLREAFYEPNEYGYEDD
jgi:hypothetical protein